VTDFVAVHGITQGLVDAIVGQVVMAIREYDIGDRHVEEAEFTDGTGVRFTVDTTADAVCFFHGDSVGEEIIDNRIRVEAPVPPHVPTSTVHFGAFRDGEHLFVGYANEETGRIGYEVERLVPIHRLTDADLWAIERPLVQAGGSYRSDDYDRLIAATAKTVVGVNDCVVQYCFESWMREVHVKMFTNGRYALGEVE
jgi:hypothetical protein